MKQVPYRLWLLLVVLAALVIGCINPVSTTDIVYEHIPTVIALAGLVWWGCKRPLSNLSYTLLALFFLLHILGAHYLYSNVPYDDWTQLLFGRSFSSMLGWERNCYDRLVHCSFGLLIAPVIYEMGIRSAGLRPGFWPALLAVSFVSLFGNVYEVVEWGISIVMSPENAEAYNGQQGDAWDAQKDLALSFIGSILSAGLCWLTGWQNASATGSQPRSR